MGALADPDVWVRAEAAFFLAQSADGEIAEALLKALEEDELPVRLGALRGLAEVGCGFLFDAVKDLAGQEGAPVEIRQAALGALARSGRSEAVRVLVEAVSDARWEVRSTAIELMGKSRDRRYVPVLLKEMEKDPDPLVRQTVIHALVDLKAIEAVPRMLNYLTDPALKDATFAFFLSLGKEHVRLIENEAKSVDFQTKLILIEILKHLENL
jgi:HEAT repeat protein